MTITVLEHAINESSRWQRCLAHPGFADVPQAEFSFATLGKLLMDEALIKLFAISSPDFWIRDGEVDEDAQRELAQILALYEAQGWLDDPRAFHPDPPPLEEVRIVAGRRGHHHFEHMMFESGYSPHREDPVRTRWLGYRANRTAHAWLLRHSVQENRPWLICLHGIGMGTPYMDFPAFRREHLYEDLGFNVLWYVKPFHGPRRGRAGHRETFSRGIGNLIQAQAQTVWDLRRVLSWIHAQHDTSVGVYGLSLGGYAGSLLSTLTDDLDLVVAGVPGTDFVTLLQSNTPGTGEHEDEPDPLESFWRDARRAMSVTSPFSLPCRVPRERRFIFGGLVDRLTPPDGVRALWEHWERPRIAWYEGSHASFLFEREVDELLDDAFAMLER